MTSGLGMTLQPEWLVGDDLRSGRLVHVLDEYLLDNASELPAIYAVFPKPRNHPKKVEAFVKFFGGKIESKLSASSRT